MKNLWRYFLDCRTTCLILGLVFFLLLGLTRLERDNTISRWLRQSESQREDFTRYKDLFGADDFMILVVGNADPADPPLLNSLSLLKTELKGKIPIEDFVAPILAEPYDNMKNPLALAAQSGIASLLLNTHERYLGILILPSEMGFTRKDVAILRDEAQAHLSGHEWHLAGPPVFNEALSNLGEENETRLYPWVGVLTTLGIALAFRSFALALLAMTMAALCLGGTFGLAGWMGIRIDLVSGSLPPLLMVITLTTAIHLIKSWQRFGGTSDRLALARAVRETITPSFLAFITTAIGFGTFSTSDIPALSGMGILAPAGIFLGWLLIYSLPTLAANLPFFSCPPLDRSKMEVSRQMTTDKVDSIGRADRKARWVVFGTYFLIVASLIPLPWLSFESNPLLFFDKEDLLPKAYDAIETHLMGLSPIEILLKTEDTNPVAISTMMDELGGVSGITKVFSAMDLLPPGGIHTTHAGEGLPTPPLLRRYLSEDGQFQRITLFAKTMGSNQYKALLSQIDHSIEKHLGSNNEIIVTGIVPTLVRAQDYLLRSQAQGLAWATLTIFILTVLGIRSIWQALLFMVPNAVPVALLLGILSICRIPLDVGTIMVANVTLGIAVDDSYHYLLTFGRIRRKGLGRHSTIHRVKEQIGGAMVAATATNSVGFLALVLSTFPPMRQFGIFVAGGLWLALAAEWFLTPALLTVWRPVVKVH